MSRRTTKQRRAARLRRERVAWVIRLRTEPEAIRRMRAALNLKAAVLSAIRREEIKAFGKATP